MPCRKSRQDSSLKLPMTSTLTYKALPQRHKTPIQEPNGQLRAQRPSSHYANSHDRRGGSESFQNENRLNSSKTTPSRHSYYKDWQANHKTSGWQIVVRRSYSDCFRRYRFPGSIYREQTGATRMSSGGPISRRDGKETSESHRRPRQSDLH